MIWVSGRVDKLNCVALECAKVLQLECECVEWFLDMLRYFKSYNKIYILKRNKVERFVKLVRSI